MKTQNQLVSVDLDAGKYPILSIQIINSGDAELRIWYDSYSDGYEAPIFQIREWGTAKDHFVSRRGVDWTVNIGRYHTARPGQAIELRYDLSDGSWVLPPNLSVTNKDFSVRSILVYPRSSHSDELGVFAGALASEWQAHKQRPQN
jgi:hypothetical protein